MRKIILLLLLIAIQVKAGWYEVYTFKGRIGKYPITLSFQKNDGYWGKKEKYNLIGLYKYDKFNTPITLKGYIKDKKVELFVVKNKKKLEKFMFDFSTTKSDGIWSNLKKNSSLPLTLQYIHTIDDRGSSDSFKGLEVVQKVSFKKYYFVAVYKLDKKMPTMAFMSSLKIIEKQSNKLFQEIKFTDDSKEVGNIMTSIFDNIEAVEEKKKLFYLNNNLGRMGDTFIFCWDNKKKKFVREDYK